MTFKTLSVAALTMALVAGGSIAASAQSSPSNGANAPGSGSVVGGSPSNTGAGGGSMKSDSGSMSSGSSSMESGSSGAVMSGNGASSGDAAEKLPGHQPSSNAGANPTAKDLRGHSETPGTLKDR